MFVPFNDLSRIHKPLLNKSLKNLEKTVLKNDLILSEDIRLFEEKYSEFTNQKYTVSCANGTDAIELILRALEIGIGDEVIVPTNSFIATAVAVVRTGAKPVFVDNNNDYLIDVSSVEKMINKKTKAIIGVNLYGQMCDVVSLKKIAKSRNIYFIEDAAQSHGASHGKLSVGDNSIAAAYSFYPGKNLGGWGDGGAITTNSKTLRDKLQKIRNVGSSKKYVHDITGFNSRLNPVNGIVLYEKLKYIDEYNNERKEIARKYLDAFSEEKNILLPNVCEKNSHVWHLFVIQVRNRDLFVKKALDKGVQLIIHYPIPIHKQKAFKNHRQFNENLENANKFSKRIVSLPIFPKMKNKEVDYVIDTIRSITSSSK
tara:strand:- start:255 stop:1364 length:1110 start_codon:yes stop_codon:yes gene_type:complete